MGSRFWIAGLVLVLVAALGVHLAGRGGNRAPGSSSTEGETSDLGEQDASSPTAAVESEFVEFEGAPARATDAESQAATDPEATQDETWILHGFVRDEHTRNPCVGYRVVDSQGPQAFSNVNGMFQIEYDHGTAAPGRYRTFHVYSPDGARVATSRKALEPDLELLVASVTMLFGRVVDGAGRAMSVESIEIRDPWDELVAHGQQNANDGTFFAPTAADKIGSEVLVVHVGFDGATYELNGPTAEFLRPEGATLVLDLCSVRFHVRLPEGKRAEEVHLSLVARRTNELPHLMRRARPGAPFYAPSFPLDAEGVVDVTLERSLASLTVDVHLDGYATWSETVRAVPCGSSYEVDLLPLGAEDVIEGRVLSAEGETQWGQFVSYCPAQVDTELYEALPQRAVSTGEDGSFRIPFPRGEPAYLSVSRPNGPGELTRTVLGGERDVELRFEPTQSAVVDLLGPSGGLIAASEPVSLYWLFLSSGESRSGSGTLQSVELEFLPIGRHRLCVLVGAPALFSALDLEIRSGHEVRTSVALQPAFGTSGTIVDASGAPLAGVRVRLLDPPWPVTGSGDPFATRSKADGSFHVFLADRAHAELELVLEGRPPLRVQVQADTPATWTLP